MQLTNKTQDKDLKVWYRLGAKASCQPDSLNVSLALTARKTHLFSKNSKIVETLLKVDPTKHFFFKDMSDIVLELEATVRNEGGMQGRGATGKTI